MSVAVISNAKVLSHGLIHARSPEFVLPLTAAVPACLFCLLLSCVISPAQAQKRVFARYMVTNQDYQGDTDPTGEAKIAAYEREIQQAQAVGIDGFALNVDGWLSQAGATAVFIVTIGIGAPEMTQFAGALTSQCSIVGALALGTWTLGKFSLQ
jgi:hypothetical protein